MLHLEVIVWEQKSEESKGLKPFMSVNRQNNGMKFMTWKNEKSENENEKSEK